MSTTEEYLMKTLGAKDIQIASLMAQVDQLREKVAQLEAQTKSEKMPAAPIKQNGKEQQEGVVK